MILFTTIAWLGSWLFIAQPEITGIKITGDTCDINSPISFEVTGTSSSTYFTWDFNDPSSGNNNIITIEGSNGNAYTSHTFSSPGEYEVHVYFQETGNPETRLCKKVSVGNCCPGSNSSITNVTLCTDQLPYSWNGKTYSSPGNYNIRFTNAAGCDSVATLTLQLSLVPPYLGNDTTLCPGDKLLLNPGKYSSYLWQDLGTSPVLEVTQPGLYRVTVQNGGDCAGTDVIEVRYENNCGDIFFPSAITPNNDGNNDAFGALGNVSSVSNYQLVIYNRFGQVVFNSTNPFQHWNGLNNSYQSANNNFVWNAAYTIKGRPQKHKKGNLVVLK